MCRLFAFLVTICLGVVLVQALDSDDTDEHWEAFKEKFNKKYDSEEEENQKRENFEKNLLHVALHNVKDEHAYDKDLHEFSDLTVKEQIDVLCRTRVPVNYTSRILEDFSISERALTDGKDWHQEGMVLQVVNQGECGSCWAYSAAQAIESQVAIRKTRGNMLSKQQMVDCAGSYGNYGCDGGWPDNAFMYVKSAGGLVDDNRYPYTGLDGYCDTRKMRLYPLTKISGHGCVRANENEVAAALATKGPLTCAVHVSEDFMHYSGGIYEDKTFRGEQVNHAVVLVGFGTENGKDFWKIKNSWGSSWGEGGYMRLVRNKNNHLHVASYTCYPIL